LKNILSFSKEQKPHAAKNNLSEVIEQVLLMNEDLFREKSITIKKELADLPGFIFDRDMLIEVLENIFLNAIDSMSDKGTLTVTSGKEKGPEGSGVIISIQDTGHGISEDQLDMIFEPFYTTKVAEQGTGLGLSITKKIMESLGGGVAVESSEGRGSLVTLSLPFDTGEIQG
jgi:two-component system NtrC family sensor kinase